MSMHRRQHPIEPLIGRIHTAYGIKPRLFGLAFPPNEDRTKQAFKDECDINNIMARYQKTGIINFQQRFEPRYGDVSAIEFQSAMQTVARGKTMFNELPSRVRERFHNDPAQFMEFINNPANADEARELGLLKPKPADTLDAQSTTTGENDETIRDQSRAERAGRAGETHQTDHEPEQDSSGADRGTTRRTSQSRRGTR